MKLKMSPILEEYLKLCKDISLVKVGINIHNIPPSLH